MPPKRKLKEKDTPKNKKSKIKTILNADEPIPTFVKSCMISDGLEPTQRQLIILLNFYRDMYNFYKDTDEFLYIRTNNILRSTMKEFQEKLDEEELEKRVNIKKEEPPANKILKNGNKMIILEI